MSKEAKKKYKLDIFDVLKRISTKDVEFYNTLTEEEQKAFQPLIVMRWLSGTNDARQVFFLNELVNPFVFPFLTRNMDEDDPQVHRQLLYDMLTICTSGRNQRYQWSGKKSVSFPKSVDVICQTFGYSKKQAQEAMPLLSNEQVVEYAEDLGWQPQEIRDLNKELKTR